MSKNDYFMAAWLLIYCAILILIAYFGLVPHLNYIFLLYFVLLTVIIVVCFFLNKVLTKNMAYFLGMGSGIVFGFVSSFLYLVTLDEQRPRLPMSQCQMPIYGIIYVVVFAYLSTYYLQFITFILEILTGFGKTPIKNLPPEELKAQIKKMLDEMINLPELKEKNETLVAMKLNDYSDRLKKIGKQVIPVILESLKDSEFRTKACLGPHYITPYDYMLDMMLNYVDDSILNELFNLIFEPDQETEIAVINIDFSSGQSGSTFAKITIDFIAASGISKSYKYLETLISNENEFYKIKVYKALEFLAGNNKADKQLKSSLFDLIAKNLTKDKFALDAIVTLDPNKALEEMKKEQNLTVDNEFLYVILLYLNNKKMKLSEKTIVELISKIDLYAHKNSIEYNNYDNCYASLLLILNRSNPLMAKTYASKGLKWKNAKINEAARKLGVKV